MSDKIVEGVRGLLIKLIESSRNSLVISDPGKDEFDSAVMFFLGNNLLYSAFNTTDRLEVDPGRLLSIQIQVANRERKLKGKSVINLEDAVEAVRIRVRNIDELGRLEAEIETERDQELEYHKNMQPSSNSRNKTRMRELVAA